MSNPLRWVWMNGSAYLVPDGLHNDYIASVHPDTLTPDMAKWRVYAGRERAMTAQSLEAVAGIVRGVLHRDDVPVLREA